MTVIGASPFVFGGYQGGTGPCNGEPDQTPGANIDADCYHGGGFNSATIFSGQAGTRVPVPERWTQIESQWNQKAVRITTVADGSGVNPGPITSAEDTIDAVNEALALTDMYLLIETHDLTGSDSAPVGAFDQPTPTSDAENSWENQVVFWDAIIAEFDGNDRVWFNFQNEPTTDLSAFSVWTTQAEWWLRRTREHHGSDNIVVFDIHRWGQDLGGIAGGNYDAWWSAMETDGLLINKTVLSWHAYGSRSGAAYTYAQMDADLAAARAKGIPVVVGEYGQAAAIGSGNAGNDQFNRNAVEYLCTDLHGPALGEKWRLLLFVWIMTGDSGFWHAYKLTQGPDTNDLTGPLVPGVNGLSIPVWDITAAEATSDYLEPLGLAHWDISHRL